MGPGLQVAAAKGSLSIQLQLLLDFEVKLASIWTCSYGWTGFKPVARCCCVAPYRSGQNTCIVDSCVTLG